MCFRWKITKDQTTAQQDSVCVVCCLCQTPPGPALPETERRTEDKFVRLLSVAEAQDRSNKRRAYISLSFWRSCPGHDHGQLRYLGEPEEGRRGEGERQRLLRGRGEGRRSRRKVIRLKWTFALFRPVHGDAGFSFHAYHVCFSRCSECGVRNLSAFLPPFFATATAVGLALLVSRRAYPLPLLVPLPRRYPKNRFILSRRQSSNCKYVRTRDYTKMKEGGRSPSNTRYGPHHSCCCCCCPV